MRHSPSGLWSRFILFHQIAMMRLLSIAVGVLVVTDAFAEAPEGTTASGGAALEANQSLGRGVNLGNALEAPREGAWGVTLEKAHFDQIRDARFDSVRLPIRWSAHTDEKPPYQVDPSFFRRVDWAIEQALSRQLAVVINTHHYGGLTSDPDQHRPRFLAIWRQIAERYRDRPPTLLFEFLNEPSGKLTADKWNDLFRETLAVVRGVDADRVVIVGPVRWNAIDQLEALRLPEDDRRLIVTVHYYEPFRFTHQGASWVGGSGRWVGTQWLGTPEEKAAIRRDFDRAAAWAKRHGRPLYLGEFGAFRKAEMPSRARWTQFVREEAEAREMAFAYWEFCAGFGVYDATADTWRQPLRDALIPPDG